MIILPGTALWIVVSSRCDRFTVRGGSARTSLGDFQETYPNHPVAISSRKTPDSAPITRCIRLTEYAIAPASMGLIAHRFDPHMEKAERPAESRAAYRAGA